MTAAPLFRVRTYDALLLTPSDEARLQQLYEACSDYFLMCNGEPTEPTEAVATFAALPAGKTYDDKLVIGLADSAGALVGMLDLVKDFPAPGEWSLGLLLLDPEHRQAGLGAEVVAALSTWAHASGATSMRLGVLNQNKGAVRFWRRLGFQEIDRRMMTFGKKESVVRVMRQGLPSRD